MGKKTNKKKNNGLFLCSGIHRPPSLYVSVSLSLLSFLSLSLPLSLPFPPSPSAVTEQTGQVINSGATTLNLSCRQGCFSSPFGVFHCAPAMLGF